MTFLPVVQRELRVASRLRWTYWGRSLAALVAIVAGTWIYLVERDGSVSNLGFVLFCVLSGLVFAYCLFAGMMYTSDTVSSEKREGTLGLLFLTDLRGYDVILGKLAASSVAVIYRVMAVLPVIAVALLMGGVAPSEYWRMMGVLPVTLLLSLGAGMLASVLSVHSRKSASLTVTLLLAASLLNWLLLWGLTSFLSTRGAWSQESAEAFLVPLLAWESPVMAFLTSFDAFPRSNHWMYLPSLGWSAGLGLVFLGLASYLLPRAWHDSGESRERRGVVAAAERWWLGGASGRMAHRRRLLEAGPMVWLNGRHVRRVAAIWGMLALLALVFVGFGRNIGFDEPGWHVFVSITAHLILKIWISSEAPRRFFEDRRSGAMELYLCTPLGVREILRGQFGSLLRFFGPPIAMVLICDSIFMFRAARHGTDDSFAAFWLIRMAFLLFDAVALAHVGSWLGLTTGSNRTTGGVFWRVLVVPVLVFFAGATVIGVLNLADAFGHIPVSSGAIVGTAWCLIGVLVNAYWIRRTRREMSAHFREYATLPIGKKAHHAKVAQADLRPPELKQA